VPLNNTEDLSMWLQRAFPVNRFPSPESSEGQTMTATCGRPQSQPLMLFDQDTASLKTLQLSLIADTSESSSETWLRAGIVSGGEFFQQQSWERRISEIGCGLLPTPAANDPGINADRLVTKDGLLPDHSNQRLYDKDTGRKAQVGLTQVVQMWPTPRSREAGDYQYSRGDKSKKVLTLTGSVKKWPTPTAITDSGGAALCKWGGSGARQMMLDNGVTEEELNGALNPFWVEWLMSWPIGWTSLDPLPQSAVDEWADKVRSGEWWANEPDIPRVAQGVPNRTHRLKAIGNGQASPVVAMAWKLLTEG